LFLRRRGQEVRAETFLTEDQKLGIVPVEKVGGTPHNGAMTVSSGMVKQQMGYHHIPQLLEAPATQKRGKNGAITNLLLLAVREMVVANTACATLDR